MSEPRNPAWDAARAALCVAAEQLGEADADWRARGALRGDRRRRASAALVAAQRRVLAAALALHRAAPRTASPALVLWLAREEKP